MKINLQSIRTESKEATLAAIDAALEYLETHKQ